jgi:hypothetical protein
MLTPLDDTLWHQLPTTFDHVGTSDPRFFDRYWFACYAPDGRAGFQMTMGAYRNMNVLDGGVAVVRDGRQHNLRVSRSLHRSAESQCGPLRIVPRVPLRVLSLSVGPGEHPVAAEITWRAIAPAYEEHPHFERLRGRLVQEYLRFTQLGTAEGWIEVAPGWREEIDGWFACRDHSWGVRRGMGIREPITGPKARLSEKGHVQAFLYFSTEQLSGTVHLLRRGDDAPYVSGVVTDRDGARVWDVVDVGIDVGFFDGTRRFRHTGFAVTLSDRSQLRLDAEASGASFAMTGLGYSGGYDDRGGPGVWRGDEHRESDVWDVSDPAVVRREDGSAEEPWHRVQPVALTAKGSDGVSTGMGSLTLTVTGKLPRYLEP